MNELEWMFDFYKIIDKVCEVGNVNYIKQCSGVTIPEIRNVVFNDPATIVFWGDGTKTIVKCQKDKGDVYSKEAGLAMAIVKKVYGNNGNYNNIFNKWIKE